MKITRNQRTVTVKLSGEIDHHSIRDIREEIDKMLDQTGAVNVAFDMTDVNFMDSSGIGLLMGRYKRVRSYGGQVIIIGATPSVKRILKMSGIGDIMIMVDKMEDEIPGVAK